MSNNPIFNSLVEQNRNVLSCNSDFQLGKQGTGKALSVKHQVLYDQ